MESNTIGYKILDNCDSVPKFMFKGLSGTRTIQLDTDMVAERKWVSDGTGKRKYWSGFHVMKSLETMADYLKRFKHLENRVVVECFVDDCNDKPSNDTVWLAGNMVITTDQWERRIKCKEFINA